MTSDIVAIIVAYQFARLTIESIRSLAMERDSSGLSLSAIIIDNASGDAPAIRDAIDACGWSGWVPVHCAPVNGGFAYGNNLGWKLACAHGRPASESRVMNMMGQTTLVTDTTGGVKRLPPYWFESKRHDFVLNHGIAHAMAIDIVVIISNSIGMANWLAQGRRERIIPYYGRDLMRYSVLSPRNRAFLARRLFRPSSE